MTIKPGDKIRFKPNPNGVRLNSALDLTAEYVGKEHCVFSWEIRRAYERGTAASRGESHLPRRRWDEEIEAVPHFFEAGKTYTRPDAGGYATIRFEVVRVDEDIDGRLAYGRQSREGVPGSDRWALRFDFDGWKEVT